MLYFIYSGPNMCGKLESPSFFTFLPANVTVCHNMPHPVKTNLSAGKVLTFCDNRKIEIN